MGQNLKLKECISTRVTIVIYVKQAGQSMSQVFTVMRT